MFYAEINKIIPDRNIVQTKVPDLCSIFLRQTNERGFLFLQEVPLSYGMQSDREPRGQLFDIPWVCTAYQDLPAIFFLTLQGMVQAAIYIKKKLKEDHILTKAFEKSKVGKPCTHITMKETGI